MAGKEVEESRYCEWRTKDVQNTIKTGGILHKIEVSGQLWLEKGRGNCGRMNGSNKEEKRSC